MLRPVGSLERLVQDDRLLRLDLLSFGEPRWLYIVVNQLHRAPALNGVTVGTELTYRITPVLTWIEGIAGR